MTKTLTFRSSDVTALLDACQFLRGQLLTDGADKGLWWEALMRAAWDTRLPLGELLNLQWKQVDGDRLQISLAEGDIPVVRQLLPQTVIAMNAVRRANEPMICAAEDRLLDIEWRELLRLAGLKVCRRTKCK